MRLEPKLPIISAKLSLFFFKESSNLVPRSPDDEAEGEIWPSKRIQFF